MSKDTAVQPATANLYDYATGQFVRVANDAEIDASIEAQEHDALGVILVDGHPYFVAVA